MNTVPSVVTDPLAALVQAGNELLSRLSRQEAMLFAVQAMFDQGLTDANDLERISQLIDVALEIAHDLSQGVNEIMTFHGAQPFVPPVAPAPVVESSKA